jgi:ferric-dicitrate binding protein FerR (iron transport regulator)
VSEQHQTDFADRSARVLREARARIAPQRSVDPEPGIEMVAGAIRGIASRQRRRRLTLSVAAAGALCAGAMAVFAAVRGQPTVTPPPVAAAAPKPVDNGFVEVGATPASLRAGDRLHSGSRAVELDARDGTSVRLAAGSDLQLLRADAERWLRLAAGTVSVHVAKLQPGQRFVIVTPDAEVEVRGTRFQVQVGDENDGCGKVTHVRVDEGIVDVRSGGSAVRVPAGGRWPTGCEAAPAGAAAPASPGLVRAAAVVAHPAARRPRPSSEPAPTKLTTASAAADVARASTLATENDLFGSALRAEHHGDRREAIELLDVLLSRFPGTPLRASALAARDRLSQAGP